MKFKIMGKPTRNVEEPFKNTELLQRCTSDGLLHGGPHFVSQGIKPCVHHTFTHVKPLTAMLDHWDRLPQINKKTPLPRELADGVKYFEELDVVLFARGNWRGTVSAYDAEYHYKEDFRQATGASLALLYHNKAGLLCAASMAKYKIKEAYNQQPASGKDIALTPRIEAHIQGDWYTNLYDLEATFKSEDNDGVIKISSNVKLKNETRETIPHTASSFDVQYICSKNFLSIALRPQGKIKTKTSFVLPIISALGEVIKRINKTTFIIKKPDSDVKVEANVPLKIKESPENRTFNQVPGVAAIPFYANFDSSIDTLELSVSVL